MTRIWILDTLRIVNGNNHDQNRARNHTADRKGGGNGNRKEAEKTDDKGLSPRVKTRARQDNEHILIGVSDRGRGISQEDHAKLFEPFERLQEFNHQARSGTWLDCMQKASRGSRGKIWAESKPGYGTTFWFTLPVSPW